MDEALKIWVPDSPVNQSVKLDCLKLASDSSRATHEILPLAKLMYEWVMEKQQK